MRRKTIRIMIWMLVLILPLYPAAAESISPEGWFGMGIASLTVMTAESAAEAGEYFAAAGGYGQAHNMRTYASALNAILSAGSESSDLKMAVYQLKDLAGMEELNELLETAQLPSCDSLITYAGAYQMEQSGDYFGARKQYAAIRDVLDAQVRMYEITPLAYEQGKALYEQENYEAAAEIFRELDWDDSAELYQKAYGHLSHDWTEADCEHPRTCTLHGETEGEPLGHEWQGNLCTGPRTCARCGVTEESGIGHDWREATCTEPKTCNRCGATEGSPLDHDWLEATYTTPRTCSRCGLTDGTPRKAVRVGSTVRFGRYEQDNNPNNGEEPIEWIVLDYDGGNHRVLLRSRFGLDVGQYNAEHRSVTWESCSLRTWLNSDFLNRAFTAEEQSAILTTTVDNSSGQHYRSWQSVGGYDTEDRVFLLSYAEAHRYLEITYDDRLNTSARVSPTDYALAQGAYTSPGNRTSEGVSAGWWWLRSPGFNQDNGAIVSSGGSLSYHNVNDDNGMICPVLWLDLESGVF